MDFQARPPSNSLEPDPGPLREHPDGVREKPVPVQLTQGGWPGVFVQEPARRIKTPSGTVSLHRIPLALFGGYHITDEGAKVATPEKALFDLIYLSPTRSRLIVSLPELELPKTFRWAEVNGWVKRSQVNAAALLWSKNKSPAISRSDRGRRSQKNRSSVHCLKAARKLSTFTFGGPK